MWHYSACQVCCPEKRGQISSDLSLLSLCPLEGVTDFDKRVNLTCLVEGWFLLRSVSSFPRGRVQNASQSQGIGHLDGWCGLKLSTGPVIQRLPTYLPIAGVFLAFWASVHWKTSWHSVLQLVYPHVDDAMGYHALPFLARTSPVISSFWVHNANETILSIGWWVPVICKALEPHSFSSWSQGGENLSLPFSFLLIPLHLKSVITAKMNLQIYLTVVSP